MEFRVIKTFQTIVRLGSFQLAAEYLKYSQPTITLHIQKLESELGFKLLERGKSIKLTEAGKIFYERANILLKEYEYLNNTLKDYSTGEAGTIRIGAAEPTASSRLPSILSLFKKDIPTQKLAYSLQTKSTFINIYAIKKLISRLALYQNRSEI